MASPAKIRKVDNSDSNRTATATYKNNHFSQSRMKLYMHEDTADIHFVFQTDNENTKVPAHQIILGMGSPVSYWMFYGSLQKYDNIRITDATIEAF